MARKLIDISMHFENEVLSDPPGMGHGSNISGTRAPRRRGEIGFL